MSYWEKMGFLQDIPKKRKKEVEDKLSFTYFYIANLPFGEYTIMIPPIIIRILRIINLTEEEIMSICKEIIHTFDEEFKKTKEKGIKEPHIEYCKRYAENYINNYK
jgi:hypothetical protein